MCVISVNVDEAVLRDLRPELNTTKAIRLWAQQLVDQRMQQIRMEKVRSVFESEANQEVSPCTVEK